MLEWLALSNIITIDLSPARVAKDVLLSRGQRNAQAEAFTMRACLQAKLADLCMRCFLDCHSPLYKWSY